MTEPRHLRLTRRAALAWAAALAGAAHAQPAGNKPYRIIGPAASTTSPRASWRASWARRSATR